MGIATSRPFPTPFAAGEDEFRFKNAGKDRLAVVVGPSFEESLSRTSLPAQRAGP